MKPSTKIRWVTIAWAITGIALFATTHRLWTGESSFPSVPLLDVGLRSPWIASLPSRCTFGVLITTLGSVLILALRESMSKTQHPFQANSKRTLILVHCLLLLALFIANQHCLQPWAYLSVIIGCILTFASPQLGARLLRILVIAIYFYSAISKLDHQFIATLGQRFLYSSLGLINCTPDQWSPVAKTAAIATFPIMELLAAVGLLWHRSRRPAICLTCLMHLGLILILSSGHFEQQPAVLIWNAFFVVQVILLFGWGNLPTEHKEHENGGEKSETRTILRFKLGNVLAVIAVAAAVLLPLLEPWGRFDHWPSWGLYAPRNSRVIVYVEEGAIEQLPHSCREALTPARFEDPDFNSPAYRLPINHWSLMDLHVPAYPQDRFQIAVALAVADRYQLGDAIHVQWQSKSHRFTGQRSRTMIDGVDALREYTRRFRLNALPSIRRQHS